MLTGRKIKGNRIYVEDDRMSTGATSHRQQPVAKRKLRVRSKKKSKCDPPPSSSEKKRRIVDPSFPLPPPSSDFSFRSRQSFRPPTLSHIAPIVPQHCQGACYTLIVMQRSR
jgi:hypothetical protein